MMQLKEIPEQDRPRERLQCGGALALSDIELLTLVLGAGTRGRGVLRIAHDLLPIIDKGWPELKLEDLVPIQGVGLAKAATLVAALEFARRRIRPAGLKIGAPEDVLPLVRHLADRPQEHFICVSLNGAHEVIKTRVITIGLVNSTQVHPREVFADPICDRACAVIVAHNHPSGNLTPSVEDRRVTRSLVEAGAILGIKLLDHLIFSASGYYSFAQHDEL